MPTAIDSVTDSVIDSGGAVPGRGRRRVIRCLMALPSFHTVDPGRERLRCLSLEDWHETAPLPGSGEGLTSRKV